MHFSNVFIRKISRSSNRIAELKIFIYLHCQHLLNTYFVPHTIINTPSTQIFLFNFYNNCMKYRYYYFPYFAVEETEAQIKKKKSAKSHS